MKFARFAGQNPDLTKASCFLGISKDVPYYQGESLRAILNLISRSEFSAKRLVMYADALDAYNLIIRDPSSSLNDLQAKRQLAIQGGDVWLASPTGGQLLQSVQWSRPVIRWSEILENPYFATASRIIDDLYVPKNGRKILESRKSEEHVRLQLAFSNAVDRTVGERIAKLREPMGEAFDLQRIFPLVLAYILEESKGELVIAEAFACEYELYPKERPSSAVSVHTDIIQKPEILKWLTIKIVEQTPKKHRSPITCSTVTSSSSSSSSTTEGLVNHGIFAQSSFTSPTILPPDGMAMLSRVLLYSVQINGRMAGFTQLLGEIASIPKHLPLTPAIEERLDDMQGYFKTIGLVEMFDLVVSIKQQRSAKNNATSSSPSTTMLPSQ
ncbi:MAG: hypothetical protein WCW01_02190 [Gammaproteobacteria bacterium]